jgi:hypothetical protein
MWTCGGYTWARDSRWAEGVRRFRLGVFEWGAAEPGRCQCAKRGRQAAGFPAEALLSIAAQTGTRAWRRAELTLRHFLRGYTYNESNGE